MNYEGLLMLVQKRRSTRRFKSEPIPDEYVDKIIEVARWAPSGANSQPWQFIVVKKQELKDKIIQLLDENFILTSKMELTREPKYRFRLQAKPSERPDSFAAAPVFIIMCGDPRTKSAYPLRVVLQRGESVFTSSLASAFLYMHLAAASLGLGSQWVSAIADHYVQCLTKELLGIPQELEIYDMMAVGYPASEPRPRQVRPKADIVHYDAYDRAKLATEVEVKDFVTELRSN